jgi:PAS domain S-box-containing protein
VSQAIEQASDDHGREDEYFRVLVEAMPNAILVVDRQRRISEVNRKTQELFDYRRADLIGAAIELLVPDRFRPQHPDLVGRFFQEPATRAMGAGRDLHGRRRDGSEFPVEIGLNPFTMSGELYTLASIIDISERKRFEVVHDRLAAIVESSDDAIISKTLDGVITSWNRGAERLFGYAEAEALGKSIFMLVPDDRIEEETKLLDRIRLNEHVEHFETVRRHRDGSIVELSVSLSPLRDHRGSAIGASSIMRDITEQKRRDAELRRSNAELEQFAYVASHDLQEPLRMVANYVELLAERYRGQLDERADKYIGYASDGARRMQRLVADLLAFSRVGSEGKALLPVAAGAVLEQVERSLKEAIVEAGATIVAGRMPVVGADESQLGQLFQNLISNAIKFRSKAPPKILISAKAQGEEWLFTVADNGIGMDMQYADRIFQMFQRLHQRSQFEGSGIGLAIAKRIVERHGGRIWVESQPGEGATFHFTLRAAREAR